MDHPIKDGIQALLLNYNEFFPGTGDAGLQDFNRKRKATIYLSGKVKISSLGNIQVQAIRKLPYILSKVEIQKNHNKHRAQD